MAEQAPRAALRGQPDFGSYDVRDGVIEAEVITERHNEDPHFKPLMGADANSDQGARPDGGIDDPCWRAWNVLYAIGRAPRQTIGRRAARTGRVGKRHVSDLRNDLPVQLDVFAEQFRADS